MEDFPSFGTCFLHTSFHRLISFFILSLKIKKNWKVVCASCMEVNGMNGMHSRAPHAVFILLIIGVGLAEGSFLVAWA